MIAKQCGTHDLSRRLIVALMALTVGIYLGAGDLSAQEFEVPEGFMDVFEPEVSSTGERRYLRTIRPLDGPFSNFSAIRLREVMNDIDDPADWLRERLRVDVGDMGGVESLLNSPDSPFGDPAFDALSKVIPELSKFIATVAELPLSFCDEPHIGYNASGGFHELYCVYNVGPLRRHQMLRLQRVGNRWFFTEITTMNERRLRHLLVIANSFTVVD